LNGLVYDLGHLEDRGYHGQCDNGHLEDQGQATTNEHNSVFLEVVTFTTNVSPNFLTVG
jgi:hypothetical protein